MPLYKYFTRLEKIFFKSISARKFSFDKSLVCMKHRVFLLDGGVIINNQSIILASESTSVSFFYITCMTFFCIFMFVGCRFIALCSF